MKPILSLVPAQPVKPKRTRNSSRANLLREMKLGAEVMAKIKGTSLDSAAEMDELVVLNRGALEGEQTGVVKRLVADAHAGKDVSAVATGIAIGGQRRVVIHTLVAAWRKRMVSAWELASEEERTRFLTFLAMKFDLTKRAALLDHLMEHVPMTERSES